MKSRHHILDVPLVDVLFQEDVDIAETSRIDVDVQDIRTLIHESGELESVDIRGRSIIVDEDEEEVEWESDEEEEEEEFQSESDSETGFYPSRDISFSGEGSLVETSTPSAVASIPLKMSPSPIAASIFPGTSTPPTVASIPPATLTPFQQLPYSSPVAISTASASSAAGMSSRHSPSSSARPLALTPSSCPSSVLSSRVLLTLASLSYLPLTGENGQGLCIVRSVCPTASAEGTVGRYMIQRVLDEELKANTEHLYIEIGSPILTYKQLMFRAFNGSNKEHVYGYSSQSTAITVKHRGGSSSSSSSVPSESSVVTHESSNQRERRL
ncbi:hypothetical protein M9H77_22603 [Catharanthus roseus]|uniref:Uncharacterized protein n=1 Tax=Catharanthus roseus TaxID=4058 RepID=A0ACC0AQX9_CATRO|nr:hypothetical protein M9H77_22603 [Catharanthus roseus]